MLKKDSTLREAIIGAAFERWCEIATLDELIVLRDKQRAENQAAEVEGAGREIPAGEPASVAGP